MKASILNFIKTANNIFFFLGAIALTFIVGWEIYKHNFRDDGRSFESIQIVENQEATNIPIEYRKHFLTKFDDVYTQATSRRSLQRRSNGFEAIRLFEGVVAPHRK